jgi:hypothetical protein
LYTIVEVLGVMAWVFQAFTVTASVLSVIGLVLAFSGTYAGRRVSRGAAHP